MSNVNICQPYVVDYEKVVQEFQEMLYKREELFKNELQTEYNPIKYIEIKAMITDVGYLRERLYEMFEWYKKPVEVKKDE